MVTENLFDRIMARFGEVWWKTNVQKVSESRSYHFHIPAFPNYPHVCIVTNPWPGQGERVPDMLHIRWEAALGICTNDADFFRCLVENYTVGPPFFALKRLKHEGKTIPQLVMVDTYQFPWQISETDLWDIMRFRYARTLLPGGPPFLGVICGSPVPGA
jgi:hypothetical protein